MPFQMMEKRATTGGKGGLSYEAITAITICVAGFVMLMVLACAINMRRRKGDEGKVDASDLDPEQQTYMRDVRYRNRDTLTGTNHFTLAAGSNPPSRQPTNYMSRSGMSGYGYDEVYTPGWESGNTTKRSSSAYVDHSPEGGYFNDYAAPVGQPVTYQAPNEMSEKPAMNAAVQEAEPTPYAPADPNNHNEKI
ncbi:hypothetical protein WHR41_02209 [Cladosporium halotolerans]|uniref:Uncharacterized protein n=1 Tax=Cladosporium halotolerans TaxID=1052096 RepID=A0AB34KVI5_9PEZI